MIRNNWIRTLEYIRTWRLLPRLGIAVYLYLVFDTVTWYMTLTVPTAEQTAFISAIVGVGAAWFGLFLNNINKIPREEDCNEETNEEKR